jgi:hypothetical protein
MWPPLASFMNSKGTIQCYSFVELLNHVYTRPARGGGRGGGNTRGPECSEGPGNHGKMFVYCLSSAISRGTGARVHKSSFCPGHVVGSRRPCVYRQSFLILDPTIDAFRLHYSMSMKFIPTILFANI